MRLFAGFSDAYGHYDPGKTERSAAKAGKVEIKKSARTVREAVTEKLWYDHISGASPLGIIPIMSDDNCRWGCIDVDKYDLNLGEVSTMIEAAGLPLMVCRTKSGGAHIFLFLSEPSPASEVQAKLKDISAALGFGGSEIFPKQTKILVERGDLGNWLNMPYFRGDDTDRYAVRQGGAGMTMLEFLDRAEEQSLSYRQFDDLTIKRQKKVDEDLTDGPPCLQHLSASGFPDGTRNNGLFALGIFCKKKFGEKWQIVLERFNQRFMSPPLGTDEVMEIIKRLEKKDYNYPCKNEPIVSHCNSSLCRTRKFGVGGAGEYPEISGISVLDTQPPIWFLDVENTRIEISTEDLQDYRRFQRRCMERLFVCYRMIGQPQWIAQLGGLMENVVRIEASEDVGSQGHFMELLEDFCTDTHAATDKKEIHSGRVWDDEEGGRYVFRLRDLMSFFTRQKFDDLSRAQVTNKIKDVGGGHFFTIIEKKGVNLWFVPAKFNKTGPLSLPKSHGEPI